MSLASNLQTAFTRVGTEFKTIRTLITGTATGDLSGLTTTDKSSLRAAINEVNAKPSGGVPSDASETVKGIAELATQTEVNTGTDDLRIVTPLKLATRIAAIPAPAAATTTSQGIVELATVAETTTGTDTTRATTPAGVKAVVDALVNAAPGTLDQLNELAAAIGNDPNFASTLATSLAGKQPLDADLTAIAALVSAADRLPYSTGAGAWSLATFTAAGRALIDDATAADQRTTLDVYSKTEIGDPTTDFAAGFVAALA